MPPYEVILHGRAWEVLAATHGAEKRRLLVILEQLRSTPFLKGDFQQRDMSGRMNEVLLLGEWLLTYWTDHAALEIRLVNLERVEE